MLGVGVSSVLARLAPVSMSTDINTTLTERGNRYGPFTGHAEVTQRLKTVVAAALRKRDKRLATKA